MHRYPIKLTLMNINSIAVPWIVASRRPTLACQRSLNSLPAPLFAVGKMAELTRYPGGKSPTIAR